jgi:hypothetical protein
VRAAYVGAFVPLQAQPVQAVDQLLLGLGVVASAVGVFDAQDELPAGLAGQQVVVQGGAAAAQVGAAGGGGGKAGGAGFSGIHSSV